VSASLEFKEKTALPNLEDASDLILKTFIMCNTLVVSNTQCS
jgi:hypothetical protein